MVQLWQFLGVQDGLFGFSGAETHAAYTYKKFLARALVLNVNAPPGPACVGRPGE